MVVWHIGWCERWVGDWSDDVEDGRVGVGSSSGEGEGDILDPELKKWAKTQLTIFINWDFNWRPSWSPLIWSSSSMDQKPNRQYQVGFKVSINWKPSSVLAILKHFNIIFPLRHVSLHFLLHPNPLSSFSSSTLSAATFMREQNEKFESLKSTQRAQLNHLYINIIFETRWEEIFQDNI